jgi:hypothetical protein
VDHTIVELTGVHGIVTYALLVDAVLGEDLCIVRIGTTLVAFGSHCKRKVWSCLGLSPMHCQPLNDVLLWIVGEERFEYGLGELSYSFGGEQVESVRC